MGGALFLSQRRHARVYQGSLQFPRQHKKVSVASHTKFADKYHLNFPLLSDEDKKVIKAYRSWGLKKFMGRTFEGTLRNTYLIGPQGEIKKTYEKVNPLTHAGQILADLKQY